MTSFVYAIQKLFRRNSLSNKSSTSSKSKAETAIDNKSSSVEPNSSSVRSNKSSDHRFDGGRRFHNREDVAYVLPNDDEEIDRIHQQHWVFKVAFQGNYAVPLKEKLEEGIKVLDSGCGPATWTLEMAETYPASQFYGVDVSSVFPQTIKPANCHFEISNIGESLPFPDNYFDFVHQRLLQMGLTASDWNTALKEHMRVVKPGGWVEVTEFDIEAENLGPKTRTLIDAFIEVTRLKGLVPDVAPKLVDMLKKAGACNVQDTVVRIPMNHSGKLGALFWDDFKQAFQALQPILVKKNAEYGNNDKFLAFLAECGEECKRNMTGMRFHRATGQKPARPSGNDPYTSST